MSKREYQEQERKRIREAADRNARPIIKFIELDGKFHVVGLTVAGKTFHEKFSTSAEALQFANTLKQVGAI